MIRSLLFVPGDSEKKLAKGLTTAADCLILDLEDSVVPANKEAARRMTSDFLGTAGVRDCGKLFFVRVNALQSGMAIADLAEVMRAHPDGIVLPKSRSGADIAQLHDYLDALETAYRRAKGPACRLPLHGG